MRKILLALLCTLSLQASAQTYGVGAGFDYDSATSNAGGLNYVNKTSVIAGVKTSYGTFDTGAFQVHIDGNAFSDSLQGAEVGYGNGLPLGPVTLSGRVAAGKLFNRGGAPSSSGTYSTFAATLTKPITKQLSAFVSMRYRPEHYVDQQHQYSLGATYMITPHMQLQGTVRQTRSTGPILNGVSTTVLYFF